MTLSASPLTQDPLAVLMAEYNAGLPVRLQLNETDFVFDSPVVNDDPVSDRNTLIRVRPLPGKGKKGEIKLFYDRINLTTEPLLLPVQKQNETTMPEILDQLGEVFGINLTEDDYDDQVISDVVDDVVTLVIKPESYMFFGTLRFGLMTMTDYTLLENGALKLLEDNEIRLLETPEPLSDTVLITTLVGFDHTDIPL